MLLIPHTIVGIAIASVVKTSWALPLAFLSHFVIDAIPHWDSIAGEPEAERSPAAQRRFLLLVAVDFLISLDIGLFFIWRALDGFGSSPDICQAAIIFFSALLANVPDAILIPRALFGKKWGWLEAYYQLHAKPQTKLPLPWGVLTQVVAAAAGLWLALR